MEVAWAVLIVGFGLGVSLAAPPGPILVLSADRAVHKGFWPGFIVTLGATVGDGTHAVLMGLGILPLIKRVHLLPEVLAVAGGLLLVYFAYGAWQKARRPPDLAHAHDVDDSGWSARYGLYVGGFAAGYLIALTSPFNFAWWLSAGTALFRDYGTIVFYGFFAGIVSVAATYVWLVRFAAARVDGVVKAVSYGSAVLLVVFGLLVLWRGVHGLVPA